MTTAVATVTQDKALTVKDRVNVVERELIRLAPQIASQLPNGMSEDRFKTVTLQALAKNPTLQECDPSSIILAVLDAASVGLEPTGVLSQAWLVPYAGKAQLQIGYNGYRTLARRSGEVSSIEARVVYQSDTFEVFYGSDQRIVHVPSFESSDPADITHAYAVTRMKDGTILFDVMTRAELDGIRARSKSANRGPWVSDTAEMYRKTVIRRHVKALPLTIEVAHVIERDDEAEFGPSIAAEPVKSRASEVRDRLAAKGLKSGPQQPEAVETPNEALDTVSASQQPKSAGVAVVEGEVREVTAVCKVVSPFGGGSFCDQPLGHEGVHKAGNDETWPR